MGMDIRKDLPPVQTAQTVKTTRASLETQKTSGSNTENNASKIKGSKVSGVGGQAKMPSSYEENQSRIILEQEMDKLVKQIMPDLGITFRIHDSGQIITTVTNNDTKEVVREFPAEKILDIVYNMCQKLGIVTNKRV